MPAEASSAGAGGSLLLGRGGGGGRRGAYGDLGAGRNRDPALGGQLGAEDLRRAGDEAHAEGGVGGHLHAQLLPRLQLGLPRRRGGGGPRGGCGRHGEGFARVDGEDLGVAETSSGWVRGENEGLLLEKNNHINNLTFLIRYNSIWRNYSWL